MRVWQHEVMQIAQLLEENYGLTGEITQLPGERDLNYKISGINGEFIFKVHNASEQEFIELQQEVLQRLTLVTALNEPRPVKTVNGELIINLPDNKIGRLLTWADGKLYSQNKPTSDLKVSLGSAVALVDRELADFDVTNYLEILNRPFGWNVSQSSHLVEKINLIADAKLQSEVREVFDLATSHLLIKLGKLPNQLIHNDANDNNIVVMNNKVSSLIDFGDVIYAPRIAGLAVACAYAIENLEDPIYDLLPVVRGYHLVSPLNQDELEILFGLIKLRIATSIVMAAIQSAADPTNDYLLVSQNHFQKLIEVLNSTDPNLAMYRFRSICGFEANPNSRLIRQYLQSGKATIADVTMPPLRNAKKIWLDWSADNPNIPRQTEQIFALMNEAGADLAIG
ncbi:MAG: hypothetical protein RIR66_720, partial [Actinomycetota bacterium]